MHVHTRYSDGTCSIPTLMKYCRQQGIGVAITDHNKIGGVIEACSEGDDILIIPGIELETEEGPHLLFYFNSCGELEDFFAGYRRKKERNHPLFSPSPSVEDCLLLGEEYGCLKIAAHPYGYFGINRGILKCVDKQMLPGVLDHIDGFEVLSGGMMKNLNQKAVHYSELHQVPFTGGSDAHILAEVGSVITGVRADSPEEFIKGILRRENIVIGSSGRYINKPATAGIIAWSFVPYTAETIKSCYVWHQKQFKRYFSEQREKTNRDSFKKEKKSE